MINFATIDTFSEETYASASRRVFDAKQRVNDLIDDLSLDDLADDFAFGSADLSMDILGGYR